MQLALPSPPTPASKAVALLSEIYGQHVPQLAIQHADKLRLSVSGAAELTTLPEIATALLEAAGKASDTLGASDNEKVQVKSWLEKIGAGQVQGEAALKSLNDHLTSRTFLVGSDTTAADLSLFASLHSYIAEASHATLLTHPSITRHFDHIQYLPLVSSVLARSTTFQPSLVPIDVNNVPLVEIEKEVKVRKEKVEVAPPASEPVPGEQVKEKEEGKKGEKKIKEKKAAGGEGGKKAPPPAPVAEAPAPWMIDLRVGTIIDVKLHPDADSLYVETIDVGEPEPRTVVSGLVKYMTLDQMRGRTLITVCNLKPANMRGVKSFAMVLCASSKEGKDAGIEFVDPPAGSKPGDRVYFEGFESEVALDILNPKKKIWEAVQPGFTTLDTREAAWVAEDKKVHKIVTALGPCAVKTFVGASLS